MKKRILVGALSLFAFTGLSIGTVQAASFDLDYWTFTSGSVNFILTDDLKNFEFGVYDFGNVSNTITIFEVTDKPITTVTWEKNPGAGDFPTTSFEPFGFYFANTSNGKIWYTDVTLGLNSGDNDLIGITYTSSNTWAIDFYKSDLEKVRMEVIGADIAPVPEPTTMLLFGAGLAGLAGISRRKKN